MGKKSYKYAWIFNQMKRRRDLAVNIDISSCQFETYKNSITLMDGPGSRDFTKCMLTTISLVSFSIIAFNFTYTIIYRRIGVYY